jgi:hypothetical protein
MDMNFFGGAHAQKSKPSKGLVPWENGSFSGWLFDLKKEEEPWLYKLKQGVWLFDALNDGY